MRRSRRIAFLAIGLAALAGTSRAEYRTNMNFGNALLSVALPPAGFESDADAARAARKGKIARAPKLDSVPDNVIVLDNVVYASQEQADLHADVYRPRIAASPSPVLLFVHGGAWDHGNEDSFRAWGVHYAQRGYVCVAATYRLSVVAAYPAALDDVREALRWVQSRAGEWGADPARVAVIGQSAGAHLALLSAYQFANAPRVQAVVDFYGPSSLADKPLRTASVVQKFLGGKRYRKYPEVYRNASPMTYVSAQCPPTLIFHGTVDSRVPVEQSDTLADALRRENVPFLYDRVDGWQHAMDQYAEVNAHCLAVMDVFLDRVLGKR